MADPGVLQRLEPAGNPVADPAAVVAVGSARFTVLTDRLIRMEWSATAAFEDRASFAFPHRRAEVPAFEVRSDPGDVTVVDTGALVLRYAPDGGPFTARNLSVELAHHGGEWVPGQRDLANLGGARRTVDGCRGDAALEPGLVSRSGWAVVDDSRQVMFAPDGWVEPRGEPDTQDWYFFGYGHDFATAVSDYTRFGGQVPMVPRWVLGSWWSRYFAYRDEDLCGLVETFAALDLPLDVLVIDMDWHKPDSWTGYSWNRELFPDPPAFLAWLHARGLHTTLNLHPALGVQAFEDAYAKMARANGVDPASGEPVPFRITDRAFVTAYFELLHHPLEDDGIDFWWMDWQQGRTSEMAGLDPLPWLNHLHFHDLARHDDRRPLVFSRWGGLGSHRYPVGFSGDSWALWSALAFQPRYTAAGANVGYGWWSHDIGGHHGPDDPELYVRWVQFGALSPVLRLHSDNRPESERRPWLFGDEALTAVRAAYRSRYELVPYLYTAARAAHDTGISVVRPTAWTAPDHDGAYLAREQYLLGPDLLVAPVVRPAEPTSGLAEVDVWLPPGTWVERSSGEELTGPRWLRLGADLTRMPQFVRPGTVLPLADVALSTAAQPADHLTLSVFTGAPGATRVYQDDGNTSAYQDGGCCWTPVSVESPDAASATVTVGPAVGAPPTSEIAYTVRFEHVRPPLAVSVDGDEVDTWSFDQAAATVTVDIGRRARDRGVIVRLTGDGPLSIRGAGHNQALRRADLRRLLGDSTLGDEALPAAVGALPAAHPSRQLAVARLGGPTVQVIEHVATDEAARTVGRVIVGAPETGPAAEVSVRWTVERGSGTETTTVGPVSTTGDGAVLDVPIGWDGTLAPVRWSAHVTTVWGDVTLVSQHTSAVLNPAISSWWVATAEVGGDRTEEPAWERRDVDPADPDFPNLAQRSVEQFAPHWRPPNQNTMLAHAVTMVSVPTGREVAFAYQCGTEIQISVDGEEIAADVTGHGPASLFDLHPDLRRTAAVGLGAGAHTLQVRVPKPAGLRDLEWYLSMSVVDPIDGRELVDVAVDAGPRPARPPST